MHEYGHVLMKLNEFLLKMAGKTYTIFSVLYFRYTIIFIIYSFELLLMMLFRPILSVKLCKNQGRNSIYAALYFLPVLVLFHAVFAGLVCKSSYITLVHAAGPSFIALLPVEFRAYDHDSSLPASAEYLRYPCKHRMPTCRSQNLLLTCELRLP